ncbi:hypothetical protein AVEN_74259-1 [Araneus ventricosus]|uniref:Kelch-like protein 10 n=1 Tax=Araneus ventricosus TaxID=182803 RepID=A0A4Y2RQP1_ARAVE|nr:hypothetical protein AVEN_74259-1 [Araneus ventricosus]
MQLDRYVYMFKTSTPAHLSLAFDMFDEKCLPMTPIYESRCCYSVSGYIYIMGGFNEHFNRIEDIERFDPRTGKWELISRMIPMSLSKTVSLNGYICAIRI